MPAPIFHYCQKCLAGNSLGQDFCSRCGTRLMIIVEPSASRFEANEASISSDEHLLERISATENRITRLAERLERSLDLLLLDPTGKVTEHAERSFAVAPLGDTAIDVPFTIPKNAQGRCTLKAVAKANNEIFGEPTRSRRWVNVSAAQP